jgi:hypothetical protein
MPQVKKNKKKQFWSGMKRLDIFGKDVTLTFQGKETFKTSVGTILTIIYTLALFTKSLTEFSRLWEGQIMSVSS